MERRFTEKEIVKTFIMNGYNEKTIIQLRKILNEIPFETAAWVPKNNKKGRSEGYGYMCSKCKGSRGFKFKYCPDCGTEMINPEKEKKRKKSYFD